MTSRAGLSPSQLCRVWGLGLLSETWNFLDHSLQCAGRDTSPKIPSMDVRERLKKKKMLIKFSARKIPLSEENFSCYHFTIIVCSELCLHLKTKAKHCSDNGPMNFAPKKLHKWRKLTSGFHSKTYRISPNRCAFPYKRGHSIMLCTAQSTLMEPRKEPSGS